MDVNTYDATPLLDEVISGPSKPLRAFDDNTGDSWYLWFELSPGRFGLGTNRLVAEDWYLPSRVDETVSLSYLYTEYPEGEFITED